MERWNEAELVATSCKEGPDPNNSKYKELSLLKNLLAAATELKEVLVLLYMDQLVFVLFVLLYLGLGDLAGMEKSSNTNSVKVSTADGEDLMRNVSIANEPSSVSSWLINETNVETLFRVKLTSLSDIDDFSMSIKEGKYADILSTMSSADIDAAMNLINDIKAGKHKELLSGMTNDDRMETLDALGSICNSIQANCNNLPRKDSPSDAIVQSMDINTKSTSYAGAAGASTMA
ncbi:hypothetical protein Tco_0368719 [Tanacetum coccineum]